MFIQQMNRPLHGIFSMREHVFIIGWKNSMRIMMCVSVLFLTMANSILYASEGDISTLLDDSTLRQGPGSFYASVGVARVGEQAVERQKKGSWVQVRMVASGYVGWVYADALRRKLVAGKQVASGGAEKVVMGGGRQYSLNAGALDQAVVADVTAPAMGAAAGIVGSMQQVIETTTIRSGPGDSNDMLGWVSKGTHVRAVGQQGDWLHVSMPDGGRSGWMKAGVLQSVEMQHVTEHVTEHVDKVPAVGTTTPAGGIEVNFVRKANLRAGPGVTFEVVSWAGIGSYAHELSRKGDWVRVQMKVSKRIGWVYKRSLRSLVSAVPLSSSR